MTVVTLPGSVEDALCKKYGTLRPVRRSHSFEADDAPPCTEDPPDTRDRVRAVVCISDHMPPRPILDRPSRDAPLFFDYDGASADGDLTAMAYDTIPPSLVATLSAAAVPRAAVVRDARTRCYRARSLTTDPPVPLCTASDARVARAVAAIATLDDSIPKAYVPHVLRTLVADRKLMKRWTASVDAESVV